jgi:NhaP-type Na+/H+ or K+/H+ antiporter
VEITEHLQILAALGGVTLIAAWMPSVAERTKISYTIVMLLLGIVVYLLDVPLAWPDPFWPDSWTMMFTEAVVIISLMSVGLKIGKFYDWKHWQGPLRLLLITMPLCIAGAVILGHYLLGLPIASAVLLGAVLAPTDPVMASEVQIDPVKEESEDDFDPIRFSLTGEASLNDGLAFPFTWLAVLLAQQNGNWGEVDWLHWLSYYVVLKIVVGILVGYLFGREVGWLLEDLPRKLSLKTRDGFVAFSTTFLVYAAAELLSGYGFIAVFIAGLTIRFSEEKGEEGMQLRLHDFVTEVERLLLAVFLVLFGGSIVSGLLAAADWRIWLFAALFLLGLRPIAGLLGLMGTSLKIPEKFAISFLGIRGIGSLFYLSWAFLHAEFPEKEKLYVIMGVIITMSLLVHGLTAKSILNWAAPAEAKKQNYEVEGKTASN